MLTVDELRQARCIQSGIEPSLFDYPKAERPTKVERVRLAEAAIICDACPIMQQCLRSGMDSGDWSFRGGSLLRNGAIVDLNKEPNQKLPPAKPYKVSDSREEKIASYVTARLGQSCENGHAYTFESLVAYRNQRDSYTVRCRICEVNRTYANPWVAPMEFDKCDSGHFLVPENLLDSGLCRMCEDPPAVKLCPRNHLQTVENTYRIGSRGGRACRECRKPTAA